MKARSAEQLISHHDLLALVRYDPETGDFLSIKPRPGVPNGRPLGHVDAGGYRAIGILGRRYLAHRLAWFYVHGQWPRDVIDHKNLAKDDNRIANLREASHSQNHANVPGRGRLKGAVWNRFRGYWQSSIKVDGRNIRLGTFATAQEAHSAYVEAAQRLFGEFARVA